MDLSKQLKKNHSQIKLIQVWLNTSLHWGGRYWTSQSLLKLH